VNVCEELALYLNLRNLLIAYTVVAFAMAPATLLAKEGQLGRLSTGEITISLVVPEKTQLLPHSSQLKLKHSPTKHKLSGSQSLCIEANDSSESYRVTLSEKSPSAQVKWQDSRGSAKLQKGIPHKAQLNHDSLSDHCDRGVQASIDVELPADKQASSDEFLALVIEPTA